VKHSAKGLTRRDFIKAAGCTAAGVAIGLPVAAAEDTGETAVSKVVLIRNKDAVGASGEINGEIIREMLDQAVMALFGKDDPVKCWKQIIKPDDIVGIKTNVWGYLPTPRSVEQTVKSRVMDAGVPEKNIDIDDRGILRNPIFKKATALINARPMRTHAWSGVGSLIKNYIMFIPSPPDYHGNSCADLGAIWHLPMVKDKTRLNILVMLTPLFYGVGAHHYDRTYVWPYKGLIVGTDPVACDTTGLRIFQAKRKAFFGEDRPVKPTAHHIAFADKKYKLGNSETGKIDLIKIGWEKDILI
jgi:hypothetical protein